MRPLRPDCMKPMVLQRYHYVLILPSYHCLFSHDYEERNVASTGVLAVGDISSPGMSVHIERMARCLAAKVTYYTDGAKELAQQTIKAAADDEIEVDSRRTTHLEKGEEGASILMHFVKGQSFVEGFLVSIDKH